MKKTTVTLLPLTLSSAPPASAAEHNNIDSYESYNRFVFDINDKADHYVLVPVTRGYCKVTLKPVRVGASNFFNSLRDVVSFGSSILRLDTRRTNGGFVRVGVNTTFGLDGLIGVTGAGGIPNNKNILGDTPTSWDWRDGNYFVVPLLGFSTVRGMISSIITIIYPVKNVMFHTSAGRWSTTGLDVANNREGLLDLTDGLGDAALDKYNYTRDFYMRVRARQTGGTLPQAPDDDIDTDELVDSGKPDNLSLAKTADTPQAVSAPIAEEWVRIHLEGGSNAGQVQQRSPLFKYSEAV